MLDKAKNKALEPEEVRVKQIYHFPGGLEYEPQSVEAETREEAEDIYEKSRKHIKKSN